MDDRNTLWPRLAELPLVVDGYELEPLRAEMANGVERVTVQVRLRGGGDEGIGEDISLMPGDPEALSNVPASLPLRGDWTLARFCDHLATLDQWPVPPDWEAARLYRNWAFESAALDLALRQAGRALHEVLEREPRPLRFVNSLGLGDPPSFTPLAGRRARYPDLRFKLDADPTWTPGLIAELAATGRVDIVDFKGHYGLEVKDEGALETLYDRVLDAFPDALLEDPHDRPAITERLSPHAARVSYDAPIHTLEDLAAVPLPARTANIKPSRTGGLRPLLALYAHCEREGVAMYGGGMGELGVGRGQIQLLAALFHPDGPNDVAPKEFNAADPPAGLPTSPLPPRAAATGFRLE